jgi:hypothetical protein
MASQIKSRNPKKEDNFQFINAHRNDKRTATMFLSLIIWSFKFDEFVKTIFLTTEDIPYA